MNRNDQAVQKIADKKELLYDPDALTGHISRRLFDISRNDYQERRSDFKRGSGSSAVLLLLGPQGGQTGREPCLILNKRSAKVRQPGDICCPGGGITPVLDVFLSKLLALPGLPLGRWTYWPRWQGKRALNGGAMPLLLATGLREGFEEMRLNPLGGSVSRAHASGLPAGVSPEDIPHGGLDCPSAKVSAQLGGRQDCPHPACGLLGNGSICELPCLVFPEGRASVQPKVR